MSDYKDIIRKPETLNWFKAAMSMNIARDCLLDIVKDITQACYDNIRKTIKSLQGVPESVVCSQCQTPNVLPCDPANKCCNRKYGNCAFHKIHKPQNCPNNNLCNEICKQIVIQHRFRNQKNPQSFQGPSWLNTDASKWCLEPWQIAKCYVSKDGYKGANKAEDTDFNGIVNVIYNCEYFQTYFKDDLTQQENVCTKARDVGRAVRHASSMSMTRQDSDEAIDILVALLQSLKHVDHQTVALTTVDRLTQLKNGTLAITEQDVAKTFELFKETLTEEMTEILSNEKDKLVIVMKESLQNTAENITAEIKKAADEHIARIKSACGPNGATNSTIFCTEPNAGTGDGTSLGETESVQSNLSIKTTQGNWSLWSLFTGGLYSQGRLEGIGRIGRKSLWSLWTGGLYKKVVSGTGLTESVLQETVLYSVGVSASNPKYYNTNNAILI